MIPSGSQGEEEQVLDMHTILLMKDFMSSQLAVHQHETSNLMAQGSRRRVSIAPEKGVETKLLKYFLHRCVLSRSLVIVSGLIMILALGY